jgi:hypothetical protein
MKKIFFVLTILTAIAFSSCANLLVSNPNGSTVSEEQLQKSIRELDARVNGLYYAMNALTTYLGAQKYIDVYTDVLASDVAIPSPNWGFFYAAEQGRGADETAGFNGLIWEYSYILIRNANLLIARCDTILNTPGGLDEEDTNTANRALAHAYGMRGYAYYMLTNFYTDAAKLDANILPYYNEENYKEVQRLSSYKYIIPLAISDLERAIDMLKEYQPKVANQKSYMNADIAKMILAYLRMNKAIIFDPSDRTNDIDEALRLVKEVIGTGEYPILPYKEVLTNGFNTVVKSQNWIWAVDVAAETSRQINSFWSLADIYTYGYAAAGEYFAIDANLYNSFDTKLSATDIRKKWWNHSTNNNVEAGFALAPVNKFFDPNRKVNADKAWLNDLVYMRIEEAYLLAAEASFALGDETNAKAYIKTLVANRDTDPATMTKIDGMSGTTLKDYIASNWRIEMWLEGKNYMAMRRFGWSHTRGKNHSARKDRPISAADLGAFSTPYSERQTNPYIDTPVE